MTQKTLSIYFRNNIGRKLAYFLVIISMFGSILMIVKILLSISIVAGIFGGVLFSAAGYMDWIKAWILLGLYTSTLLILMVWGVVNAPDLMRERSRMAGNVKPWDKVVNLLYMLMLTALFLVAGLDAGRFGWSTIPLFMKWIGGLGCGVSAYVIWLTMKESAYLSRWARIQDDRGQKVISSGPIDSFVIPCMRRCCSLSVA